VSDIGIVRVERDIAASPEDVYDAWTDPESLAVWMAPDPMTVGVAECDPRVGGAFRILMIGDDGAVAHTGEYEELVRPRLLVFTWRADHLGPLVTRVRVTLTPLGAGTRMVIEHLGLPAAAREGHEHGWGSIAGRLAAAVGAAGGG
jgi:uncharacterized protein YndB with AHSA1/START domain